jgi:NTE family protein
MTRKNGNGNGKRNGNGNGRTPAWKTINLALQGGGSHGAFTAGVLDALLEDGRVRFDGVSGTSAGAMNAVVLAEALTQAHEVGLRGVPARDAARAALRRFWDGVGLLGNFMAGVPLPAAQSVMNLFTPWLSPSQLNPLGQHPMRQLLQGEVDFDRLTRQRQIKVFVSATNVRTGRGEVFSGQQLSVDAVMASACVPALFQPVQIGGDYYWDGGYSGNPVIHPLIYHTESDDVLLVQINPIEAPYTPGTSAQEIGERVNEIAFNAPLLAELRAIEFVSRLLAEERLDRTHYKNVLMHRVDGGAALLAFGAASKSRADSAFITRLYDLGRDAGYRWLQAHYDDIGARSSMETVTYHRTSLKD